MTSKEAVRDFWNAESCGERYRLGSSEGEQLDAQAVERYRLEPHIAAFAGFASCSGKDVLEIGVGMGADHLEFAKQGPRTLAGIDLTQRAVDLTSQRLALHGVSSNVRVGDAEDLPFADSSFDLVYSYGVLHHTPNTARAIAEVGRVLRPGGQARVMIYHKQSIVGYMLRVRYGLMRGKPFRPLREIYAAHLESPGTQAFTRAEALGMFAGFTKVEIETPLGFGDLLIGSVGQRHQGLLLSTAKAIYPRWLIKALMPNHGLAMMVRAAK